MKFLNKKLMTVLHIILQKFTNYHAIWWIGWPRFLCATVYIRMYYLDNSLLSSEERCSSFSLSLSSMSAALELDDDGLNSVGFLLDFVCLSFFFFFFFNFFFLCLPRFSCTQFLHVKNIARCYVSKCQVRD